MTDSLFPTETTWPAAVLESIYKIYPRKDSKKQAMQRIAEALHRICTGEIDGEPRTQADAVTYLRQKTEEARTLLYGKETRFIPYPSTYFHQSRYLRPMTAPTEVPPEVEAAIRILAQYPNSRPERVIRADIKPFLAALAAISKALDTNTEVYLMGRVMEYADAVSTWQAEDRRYIPSVVRWFGEQRFTQDGRLWQRNANGGFQAERDQLRRVVGRS